VTTVTTATASTMRPQRWGLWDFAITVAISLACAVIAGVTLGLVGASFSVSIIAGTLASWIGLAGWPIIATIWRGNGPVRDLGLTFTWRTTAWGVVAGFAGLFLAGIAAWLTMQVAGDFTSAAGEAAEQLIAESGPVMWVLFGLLLVIGAPFAEELAFRGLLFSALLKRGVRPWWVVVITAAAFAAFHIEPTRMFLLFVIGLVLGYVRMRTNGLGAPIVAHAVINAPAAFVVMAGMPDIPGMTP